ncbi:MAG: adenylate kinase [Candidatus Omnitrophica bacterium]|nr:adenylate kinase [Candidatus Omnitrophota bacterium]
MKIILLGPPGAGKGTQAKVLAKQLGLAHISTGDLLRQNVSDGTELGKEAQGYMNKGALVPDELVTKMLKTRFDRPDVRNGFILDGYPRTLKQAESLDEILKEKGFSIDKAIYLDTSDSVVIQRLSGRLVCRKCGANFHITNMPPKVSMACDNCGGELYQRSDDKEETIKNRLEVYKKESSPVINYYAEKQKLERLPADGEAGAVLETVMLLFKKHNDSLKVK